MASNFIFLFVCVHVLLLFFYFLNCFLFVYLFTYMFFKEKEKEGVELDQGGGDGGLEEVSEGKSWLKYIKWKFFKKEYTCIYFNIRSGLKPINSTKETHTHKKKKLCFQESLPNLEIRIMVSHFVQ